MLDNDGSWKPVTKGRSSAKSANKVPNGNTAISPASSTNSAVNQVHQANGESNKKASAIDSRQRNNGLQKHSPNGPVGRSSKNAQQPHRPNNSVANGVALGSNDPRKAIEKEIKSLYKYEANVKNACWHFEEEIKKSEDRLKRAFKEMHDRLHQRETELLDNLHRCHSDGLTLVTARQDTELQLKAQTARVATMNQRELEDLRQRIRTFMREKRLEEDLGRPLRFQYEPDKLIESIKGYGEVIPIGGKGSLATESPSVTSLISADAEAGDVSSIDSNSVASKHAIVSEINIGGVVIQSNSMDPQQLAELTRQMQENLRMQGISDDVMPQVNESLSVPMPQRRRAAPRTGSGGARGSRGGGGAARSGRSNF